MPGFRCLIHGVVAVGVAVALQTENELPKGAERWPWDQWKKNIMGPRAEEAAREPKQETKHTSNVPSKHHLEVDTSTLAQAQNLAVAARKKLAEAKRALKDAKERRLRAEELERASNKARMEARDALKQATFPAESTQAYRSNTEKWQDAKEHTAKCKLAEQRAAANVKQLNNEMVEAMHRSQELEHSNAEMKKAANVKVVEGKRAQLHHFEEARREVLKKYKAVRAQYVAKKAANSLPAGQENALRKTEGTLLRKYQTLGDRAHAVRTALQKAKTE